MNRWLFITLSSAIFVLSSSLSLAASPPDYPVFVAKIPNPNDYSLFANSGWDGNWYVGFNTCWIKQLPPIPPGNYQRAYIGVKLGRMKSESTGKKPWDKKPIPGSIYGAISSTMAWTREQSFFVTDTQDLPLEGDAEDAIEGAGESQWFWAEVPLSKVNMSGDNFVAVWSPTSELLTVSSSPVIAAGWGGKSVDSWLSHDIHGAPPIDPNKTGATGISYFQPAIALKLIPEGGPHPVNVQVISWQDGTPDHLKPVLTVDVAGNSIERVWIEYFNDKPAAKNPRGIPSMSNTWIKVGRALYEPPYIFSLDQTELPPGRVQLRVTAANIWEETASTPPFKIQVSAIPAK